MAATARDLAFMVDSIPEGSTWTVAGLEDMKCQWQQ